MTDKSPVESLSFPQAIALTQSLMEQIEANKLSEAEIEQQVSSIVTTKNGGRGFFVSYLTSDLPLADNPSLGIIRGLESSVEVVSELLVKNLAMSSAMVVTHSHNNDRDNVEGSQKVYQRTRNLIRQLGWERNEDRLQQLRQTIRTGSGEYQSFLDRWHYDTDRKKAIEEAIVSLLT